MIKDYFKDLISEKLGFQPTTQQQEVIEKLSEFLLTEGTDTVFILRGFAGTGKTSLVSALTSVMEQLSRECVLIAPTGRAAKVLSQYADHPAYTIHKRIYRQKSIDQDSIFTLNYNPKPHLLFICDEASMISMGEEHSSSIYGTGRLLDDLLQFVYNGGGSRLILLGDTAQLPPVGETESPALQDDVLSRYGLNVVSYTLTQVVRQAEDSGILWNATHLRQLIHDQDTFRLPQIRLHGFPDIQNIPGSELIEALEQCYHRDCYDETIVVTRSNRRANIYNNGIRTQILWREAELESGDLLMVAKNNYFYSLTPDPPQDPESSQPRTPTADFIANGDTAEVVRIGRHEELYGFHFINVDLRFTDYDNLELSVKVIQESLQSEGPSLTQNEADTLYKNVCEDYARMSKSEMYKELKNNEYFNALQIKFAYAVTCHKSQGGQWKNVFIDNGYLTDDMLDREYLRWLYTALTRATQKVYLVNFNDKFFV